LVDQECDLLKERTLVAGRRKGPRPPSARQGKNPTTARVAGR
jgi:hypothetical protein